LVRGERLCEAGERNARTALEKWVEKGTAPGVIIASKTAGAAPATVGSVVMTRPLCPCVKGPITEGQALPVVSNERQARELRTALHEHPFRKIHAHGVAVAGLRKLIK
jgi:hypothetical protein